MSYRSEKIDAALGDLRSEIERDLRTLASGVLHIDRLRTVTNKYTQAIVGEHEEADLPIAILRRDKNKIDWLLSRGWDLSDAVSRVVETLHQVGYTYGNFKSYGLYRLHPGRDHVLYPRWLLDELSAVETPDGQLKFWKYIGLYDERSNVRELAAARIDCFGNSEDAESFHLKRKKVEEESLRYEENCIEKTQEFRHRLRRLFHALGEKGIFGVDAYNGGWSPHDHWDHTVAGEFNALSSHQQAFFENQWPDRAMRVCYVDTQWEVEQATENVGLCKVHVAPCKSVLCFYAGTDREDTETIAKLIVEFAPSCDLIASWGKDIKVALHIESR